MPTSPRYPRSDGLHPLLDAVAIHDATVAAARKDEQEAIAKHAEKWASDLRDSARMGGEHGDYIRAVQQEAARGWLDAFAEAIRKGDHHA